MGNIPETMQRMHQFSGAQVLHIRLQFTRCIGVMFGGVQPERVRAVSVRVMGVERLRVDDGITDAGQPISAGQILKAENIDRGVRLFGCNFALMFDSLPGGHLSTGVHTEVNLLIDGPDGVIRVVEVGDFK